MVGNKFDEKIVFKGQYLNTKLKSYDSKIKTKNSYCFCLTAIVHDSVCKKKMKMMNMTLRFTWKSVDIKKRKQRKN